MGRWAFRLLVYLIVLMFFACGAPSWSVPWAMFAALVESVVIITVIEVVRAGRKPAQE